MSEIIVIQKEELVNEILIGFRSILKEVQEEHTNTKEWLTTREVSDLLKISTVTCHHWSKKGILKKHRIANNVRFRKDEVLAALRLIESRSLKKGHEKK